MKIKCTLLGHDERIIKTKNNGKMTMPNHNNPCTCENVYIIKCKRCNEDITEEKMKWKNHVNHNGYSVQSTLPFPLSCRPKLSAEYLRAG